MIKVGVLGDIGSGKSFVAKKFGYPVFNADHEVHKIYKNNLRVFNKLKKILPQYIHAFPIKKNEISKAILSDNRNLKRIVKIVHLEVRKKMKIFFNKNKSKKIVVLDIPLLLENKLVQKKDILVFVHSKKKDILKRLKKREFFNSKLIKIFKKIQLPLDYKKKNLILLSKMILLKKQLKNMLKIF